jgi:hypothetical protein
MSVAVFYSCPHCRAELEARIGAWQGWMRCPACSRISLPPEPSIRRRQTRARLNESDNNQESSAASPPADSFETPQTSFFVRASSFMKSNMGRVILVAGLIVSLFLLLTFFLDQRPAHSTIFGILTLVFFLLLLRTNASAARRGGEG